MQSGFYRHGTGTLIKAKAVCTAGYGTALRDRALRVYRVQGRFYRHPVADPVCRPVCTGTGRFTPMREVLHDVRDSSCRRGVGLHGRLSMVSEDSRHHRAYRDRFE